MLVSFWYLIGIVVALVPRDLTVDIIHVSFRKVPGDLRQRPYNEPKTYAVPKAILPEEDG